MATRPTLALPRAADPPLMPGPVRLFVAVPVLALLVGLGLVLAVLAAWSTSSPLVTVGFVALLAAVGAVASGLVTWVFVGVRRPGLMVGGAGIGGLAVLALVAWTAIRAT